MRIFIQILLGNPPADGIAGNELVCQSFVVKKILHQTKAHIRTLGKSGQNDGASLVIIFHVIEKSVPDIRISGFQIGFTVRFGHFVDVQADLAVVGRKKAAVRIVDAFFHVDGTHEALLGVHIGEGHVAGVVRAAVYGRADEENIRGLFRVFRFQISPVCGIGIVRSSFGRSLSGFCCISLHGLCLGDGFRCRCFRGSCV